MGGGKEQGRCPTHLAGDGYIGGSSIYLTWYPADRRTKSENISFARTTCVVSQISCNLIVVQLLWAHNNTPVADSVGLFDDYEVWVVQPVNVLTDALVYVLLSLQVIMSEETF